MKFLIIFNFHATFKQISAKTLPDLDVDMTFAIIRNFHATFSTKISTITTLGLGHATKYILDLDFSLKPRAGRLTLKA